MNMQGELGEILAARSLRDKGYRILTANYRSRFGEIDIIALNDTYIVFVEVKTRSEGMIAPPAASVTSAKQRRIIQTALLFLAEFEMELQPRFDVIEVRLPHTPKAGKPLEGAEINHIESAFEAEGYYG